MNRIGFNRLGGRWREVLGEFRGALYGVLVIGLVFNFTKSGEIKESKF